MSEKEQGIKLLEIVATTAYPIVFAYEYEFLKQEEVVQERMNAATSIRHGKPPRSGYRIASTIRRSGHLRGRPTLDAAGSIGSGTAHSASVNLLAKPGRCAHVGREWHRSTSLLQGCFRKTPESTTSVAVKLTR